MRISKLALFYFLFLLTISCSSNELRRQISKKTKKEKIISNKILIAEIEGMVCKMGCGGAIRRELIETKAVSRVEIDYQEGSQRQTIKVYFNNNLISKEQIVGALEKINDKQFKVFPIGTSEIESSSSGPTSSSRVNMYETSFESPIFIRILS
jgi:hypothetical protein